MSYVYRTGFDWTKFFEDTDFGWSTNFTTHITTSDWKYQVSPEQVTVTKDLPGVVAEDISIDIYADKFEVDAPRRNEKDEISEKNQFVFPSSSKEFDLSTAVAELKNGVFKLTVKYKKAADPNKVRVKVKSL
jgi:HSP20 family molecular chaperone IbpA